MKTLKLAGIILGSDSSYPVDIKGVQKETSQRVVNLQNFSPWYMIRIELGQIRISRYETKDTYDPPKVSGGMGE